MKTANNKNVYTSFGSINVFSLLNINPALKSYETFPVYVDQKHLLILFQISLYSPPRMP